MNKIKNNNISFTSKIIVTSFPKFRAIHGIPYGTKEFIAPCIPDEKTQILALKKMVNKQTRTCVSINLITRPEEADEFLISPVHIHHDASILEVAPFIKRMIDKNPNIQSIIMWGYKNIKGYQSEKIFDKALNILSKEKEVTFFKGHSIPLDLETNAFYTNQGDIMYLAPKSWSNELLTSNVPTEKEFENYYESHHLASSDELIFDKYAPEYKSLLGDAF